jgi:methylenetetrahydrofolate reductase (NADPH)
MKVTDHLKQAKGPLFSFEILPPLKGQSINSIFKTIESLMEFKPQFVDVTYHREEYIYKKHENGLLEKHAVKRRPGTVGICAAIMNKFNVDAVPHIICGGFTEEETESALIDLNFLGIDNVLLLRGDAIKSEGVFKPEPKGHKFASDLIGQVVKMNQGKFLYEEIENATPTDFCIGVAAYPEKHFEAPNLKSDLKFLKLKADLGANYIVTQMFFDNQKYFDLVQNCREMGITIPIIPGLKPITSKNQAYTLPRVFNVDLPDSLLDAIDACKDDSEVAKIGIEWAIAQSKELLKAGAPCLHYYTMSNSKTIYKVAKELF